MAQSLFDDQSVHDADLADLVEIADGGIVSNPLLESGGVRQILFGIDTGQTLSEHRAPFAATVHVLDGEIEFTVDQKTRTMGPGS